MKIVVFRSKPGGTLTWNPETRFPWDHWYHRKSCKTASFCRCCHWVPKDHVPKRPSKKNQVPKIWVPKILSAEKDREPKKNYFRICLINCTIECFTLHLFPFILVLSHNASQLTIGECMAWPNKDLQGIGFGLFHQVRPQRTLNSIRDPGFRYFCEL